MRELLGLFKQTSAETYVATNGSLVVDPTTYAVYVHDGVTVGGVQVGGAPAVQSVNGRTGAVVLTSSDITNALTFTPVNASNSQTFSGNNTFSGVNNFTGSSTTISNYAYLTYCTVNGYCTVSGNMITQAAQIVHTNVITTGSTYTTSVSDNYIIVNKTSGSATTINLPATPTTGRLLFIKDGKGDAATNNITVVPAAGTIDGASNYIINIAYEAVTLVYNGTQWSIF